MFTAGATSAGACLLLAGCAVHPPTPGADDPPAESREVSRAEGSRTGVPDWVPRPLLQPIQAVPSPPEDLWERMRRHLALPEASDHPRVAQPLRWYRRHTRHLTTVLARAEPFLHHILEEIERRDMPSELLLVPIVESGYLARARSTGHAAGIWQFIPSTATHFGLDQSWWYDGRRDIHASTVAALTYLEQLHQRFDEDWLLALAAYNAGQGTVARAIRRNRELGRPTDYWHLDLPQETRKYVPRLLALRALMADPEAHDVTLPPIPDRPQVELVRTGGQIELAIAARLAGVAPETLKALNPGFERWATPPDGPHHLLVPVDRAKALRAGLAGLDPEARITWRRHRVRSGDSLGQIAARYDLPVGTLKEVNGLQGDLIRTGDHLLIPSGPGDEAPPVPVASGDGDEDEDEDGPLRHTVRPGDTLWELARRYAVSVEELTRWNDLSPKAVLRPGQTLVVRHTAA